MSLTPYGLSSLANSQKKPWGVGSDLSPTFIARGWSGSSGDAVGGAVAICFSVLILAALRRTGTSAMSFAYAALSTTTLSFLQYMETS